MRRTFAMTVAALTAGVVSASALAGQPSRETLHEEGSFELEHYCDEIGLTVEVAFVLDLRSMIQQRGSTEAPYYMEHGELSEVITNEANGKSVSTSSNVLDKDLHITDNDDGTVTIVVLATGNATLYGANGKAIARNPGQTRYELDIDLGGTPDDPDDDTVTDLRVVKGSTGRSDDFCEAAVRELT